MGVGVGGDVVHQVGEPTTPQESYPRKPVANPVPFTPFLLDWQHWEKKREQEVPHLQDAIGELARSGGLKNCDVALWDAYFDAEAQRRELLDKEYIDDAARATWRMAMFCFKRSSLDRAAERMVRRAAPGPGPRTCRSR